MVQRLNLRVPPEVAYTPELLCGHVAQTLSTDATHVNYVRIIRRSIDARQRKVFVNLTVDAYVDENPPHQSTLAVPQEYKPLPDDAPQAIVVGAGPAGLFAALRLIQRGVRPIVLERGQDVDSRRVDMASINRTGVVQPESNYCFGEGGAGAFSDGKLYTRSKKRGPIDVVLNILHQHGASADILIDAHPHIGSDRLPAVIRNIRNTICNNGGQVMFGTRMDTLIVGDRKNVRGVTTADGKTLYGQVILATGHSARDVYTYLATSGITLQAKGLAVGVRLEHPQHLIDCLQYHSPQGRGKYLPPAEYSLLTRVDDRAVYSFCMCPGGFIIPAASASGEIVVNGMSPANRGTRWANSGMVVEVTTDDIPGTDVLRMMHFQQQIEQRFYNDTQRWLQSQQCSDKQHQNILNAPAQRLSDFLAGRPSKTLAPTSYAPGIHPAHMMNLLPKGVGYRLAEGLRYFGKRQNGFITPEATLIGCETRTSAPVRIPRDSLTLAHITTAGLYPAGEGAGYAGGIVSAAVDGMRVADALADAQKFVS